MHAVDHLKKKGCPSILATCNAYDEIHSVKLICDVDGKCSKLASDF